MFDIVRRVVQARGQREIQVTLLEDLHWFDGGSAAFLLLEQGLEVRYGVELSDAGDHASLPSSQTRRGSWLSGEGFRSSTSKP